MWKRSDYSTWTETNAFEADQVQDCIVNEFTDEKWLISKDNQQTLWRDIMDAVNLPDNQYPMVNVTLQLDYAFTR
jgi:ribosomal protein L18E